MPSLLSMLDRLAAAKAKQQTQVDKPSNGKHDAGNGHVVMWDTKDKDTEPFGSAYHAHVKDKNGKGGFQGAKQLYSLGNTAMYRHGDHNFSVERRQRTNGKLGANVGTDHIITRIDAD